MYKKTEDQISAQTNLRGQMCLEIHDLTFLYLFLFISYSSLVAFHQLFFLNLPVLQWRPDWTYLQPFMMFPVLSSVLPGTVLCAIHTPLAWLISDCIFIPGCFDQIFTRKCSGKANLCSSAAMLLHCRISDSM